MLVGTLAPLPGAKVGAATCGGAVGTLLPPGGSTGTMVTPGEKYHWPSIHEPPLMG